MSKYRKRFDEEEFAKELQEHIKAKPEGFTDEQLFKQNQAKARHYKKALDELDGVSQRLKQIADKHDNDELKREIDFSINRIERAVGAYGEASMIFNHMYGSWQESDEIDD